MARFAGAAAAGGRLSLGNKVQSRNCHTTTGIDPSDRFQHARTCLAPDLSSYQQ